MFLCTVQWSPFVCQFWDPNAAAIDWLIEFTLLYTCIYSKQLAHRILKINRCHSEYRKMINILSASRLTYLYIIQSDNGGFSSWKVPLVETTYGFSNKGYPPPQWSHDLMVESTLGAKNQCRQEHQMSTVFSMCWFFDVCILNLNEPLLSLYIYISLYITV